ncbi:class I SAM-dependent methyltransferase [Flavihumibacter petaseus]|uniref:Methyltransferase domain-containing protein n=1 Tax=Flavihumibacter petaseus NBRC 106054 TaxID=1220578 RepID=A0A0E9N3X5_9BACT|nr:class I SAM-dependent methyltransferase [Flavihumibacter petaseus]GAO44687.1 hypothetical protein FPE01S_03_07260 [Flavihumibacter petaseus NBRC 106054]
MEQPEFWEAAFSDKQEMWGFEPAKSAVIAKDLFVEKGVRDVLIPGIGYGRNAQIFRSNNMSVTGIEISQTAIDLARKHYGDSLTIYHGSVTEMPFNHRQYDGIFCYALIHLFDQSEREKLISDCWQQLATPGYMVFSVISKTAKNYGKGKLISKDRYEIFEGARLYFYNREAIGKEFRAYGLSTIQEVDEQFPFYLIICKKEAPAADH